MVSTKDFESFNLGSNPSKTFSTFKKGRAKYIDTFKKGRIKILIHFYKK